mmetsp:Transcript_12343/g.18499  ORF Transcript_12343/g.18499 Transcript_12343/m.18499 type:complete len:135 (+) Transcript_12343:737-1141(+)
MATWVICELGNKPFAPAPMNGMGNNLKNKFYQRLRRRELAYNPNLEFEMSPNDISFMVEQWQCKCPITGARMVGKENLELVRWNPLRPLVPDNIVLLSTKVIKKIETSGIESALSSQERIFIEQTLKQHSKEWP